MHANSSPIVSRQTETHEQLQAVVAHHVAHPFRKPVTAYNRAAFKQGLDACQAAGGKPLILDAGCGVGLSTLHLATQFPDHFVIGVDQSADRIARNTQWPGAMPDNFVWLRANLVDYWRLLLQENIRPARHYILYPNPWPKIGHLGRRWHGHAVFPTIVALGSILECRSNWRIYIDEFVAALTQASGVTAACEAFASAQPLTPFERKYRDSGHGLWRCHVQLPQPDLQPAASLHATV